MNLGLNYLTFGI